MKLHSTLNSLCINWLCRLARSTPGGCEVGNNDIVASDQRLPLFVRFCWQCVHGRCPVSASNRDIVRRMGIQSIHTDTQRQCLVCGAALADADIHSSLRLALRHKAAFRIAGTCLRTNAAADPSFNKHVPGSCPRMVDIKKNERGDSVTISNYTSELTALLLPLLLLLLLLLQSLRRPACGLGGGVGGVGQTRCGRSVYDCCGLIVVRDEIAVTAVAQRLAVLQLRRDSTRTAHGEGMGAL